MLCECGCGNAAKEGNRFIFNHHKYRNPASKIFLKGSQSGRWTGGRQMSSGGYVYIFVGSGNHPRAMKSCPYVFEHILVMEKHLKRHLTTDEDVHHINKIRTDNRLENLKLFTKSEHSKLEHPQIDMSHRRCALCLSNKTTIQRNGRPHWQHIGRLLVCNRCYMEDYDKHHH